MDEIDKRYKSFLSSWETTFREIPSILSILSSHPELCSRINLLKTFHLDHLYKIQYDYISLISRFDHPIESSFFKDYYVPIEDDSYDFFIDMSKTSFPIIYVSYFQFEPQHWYKVTLFRNINELLHSAGKSSFDMEKHFEEFWRNKHDLVHKKVNQRLLLEEFNKVQTLPIEKNSLFDHIRICLGIVILQYFGCVTYNF